MFLVAFGKAGGAYVHQDFSVDNASDSTSSNDIYPEAALGVGYQFNPNWEVDLTGDWVFGDTANRIITNNNFNSIQNGSLTLSVTYHFA